MRLPFRSQVARRAAYLVAFVVVLGGGNLLWTSNSINTSQQQVRSANAKSIENAKLAAIKAIQEAIDINNRSWCDSLTLITSGPAPSARQPGLVKLYSDFHRLEHKFGCDK